LSIVDFCLFMLLSRLVIPFRVQILNTILSSYFRRGPRTRWFPPGSSVSSPMKMGNIFIG
jgi:hypothetical protein